MPLRRQIGLTKVAVKSIVYAYTGTIYAYTDTTTSKIVRRLVRLLTPVELFDFNPMILSRYMLKNVVIGRLRNATNIAKESKDAFADPVTFEDQVINIVGRIFGREIANWARQVFGSFPHHASITQ